MYSASPAPATRHSNLHTLATPKPSPALQTIHTYRDIANPRTRAQLQHVACASQNPSVCMRSVCASTLGASSRVIARLGRPLGSGETPTRILSRRTSAGLGSSTNVFGYIEHVPPCTTTHRSITGLGLWMHGALLSRSLSGHPTALVSLTAPAISSGILQKTSSTGLRSALYGLRVRKQQSHSTARSRSSICAPLATARWRLLGTPSPIFLPSGERVELMTLHHLRTCVCTLPWSAAGMSVSKPRKNALR